MLFMIAQIKRCGTLNATQKNQSPLQSTVLEKIRKNCLKIVKNAFFFGKNYQYLAFLTIKLGKISATEFANVEMHLKRMIFESLQSI